MAEEAKKPEDNAASEKKDEAPAGDSAPQDAEHKNSPVEPEKKPEEKQEETREEDTLSGVGVKVINKMDSPALSTVSSVGDMKGFPRSSNYIDYSTRFYKYMGLSMEEGEAEGGKPVKEEIVKIDRAPYYERHKTITKEIDQETKKNNMIQKKLAQFFKKKRMEHVLKENNDLADSQEKYDQKLDQYGEVIEIDSRQRVALNSELTIIKDKRESKYKELTDLFTSIQRRENDIGTGLINTQTGKVIPDKLVERLIRLQQSQMETVNVMRLKYIRLKDMVVEKQRAISLVDKIGEDLYLMDYEQLKIENRGLEDKIEEREEEITKLRSKYQSNIQILAHIREKSAALEVDADNLKEEISKIDAVSVKVQYVFLT